MPAGARRPFEVFVNGVAQEEGVDFELRGTEVVFNRELIAPHQWTPWTYLRTMFAGRYKTEHTVDITYETGAGSAVAHKLPILPPEGATAQTGE